MLDEIIARGWENFVARTTGPMHFRFFIQPAVAAIVAIRAGLEDSRLGRPAFFWSILTNAKPRIAQLRAGLKDVGKVLVVAALLDVIYQLAAQRGIFALELIFTALTLAFVPY